MTDLMAYLDAVRERLGKATPHGGSSAVWLRREGEKVKVLLEIEGEFKEIISEHLDGQFSHIAELPPPPDLARLLALVEAGREVIEIASDLHCQQEPKKHVRRGTGNLCDWCGFGWPCDVAALTDALTRYQAAVQEATRETGHNTGGHDE